MLYRRWKLPSMGVSEWIFIGVGNMSVLGDIPCKSCVGAGIVC